MKVVAIDPGGTIGWAIYVLNQDSEGKQRETWRTGHLGNPDEWSHLVLWNFLVREARGTNTVLICESYEINQTGAEHSFAIEQIGVVKLFELLTVEEFGSGPKVVWQGAQIQNAKTLWTIHAMRKLGVYVPNMKHGMSATRHILHYLTHTLVRTDIFSRLR